MSDTVVAAIIGGILAIIAAIIGGMITRGAIKIPRNWPFWGTMVVVVTVMIAGIFGLINSGVIKTPLPGACESIVPASTEIAFAEYNKPRPSMPAPAGPCERIVAHRDITNTGLCNIKVFGPGEEVTGLGDGTYKLKRISGTTQQIEKMISDI